ncbi:MAG: acetylornithine transaminase [Candidatus Dormibacteria bacterium]
MTRPAVQSARLDALQERALTSLMSTYARQPVGLVSGSGCTVTDVDGREYLDLVAGIAVNVLGHAHPAVLATIAEQAARLTHTSNLYYTEPQLAAAEALITTAFPSRVFFCNSGTEANEGAIKLARKWGRIHRGGATTIICARGAFHGRTMGALAATGNRRYREPFEPLPRGFVHVEYDSVEAVANAVGDDTVAVLLEPTEGEAGVMPMADDTLRGIRQLCDERNLLLILDEVQTGMGRTGRWWAHQHAGITPDVMTAAKGLGGGLPIGAILAAPRADVLEPGDHGCTFGGGPLVAAVAATVIATIEREHLVENAARVGDHLRAGLLGLGDAGVADVRGRGLMLGVALSEELTPRAARAALDEGLIVNAIGQRTLRVVPPLTLSIAEADMAVTRLRSALATSTTEGGA